MKSIVTVIVIFFVFAEQAYSQDLTYEEFIHSTPTNFGLLTVTHARNGNYSYFREHLQKYAVMQCPEMSEISVTWNNGISPEQAGFKQLSHWKRPVYFKKTSYNSMDFRYILPDQSTAKVFFSIDDDIITTCQQLRKSFKIWQENAIGDLGPLVSYGHRVFDFASEKEVFTYRDKDYYRFYSISLIGVSWVSRFFLELYNTEKSWEIGQMRKIIRDKNNCDDIALNYIISYFFQQFLPVFVDGDLKFENKPASQGFTPTHYIYREQCLKQFTQILGYNPLRLVNKKDEGNSQRHVSVTRKYSVFMKKQELSERYLSIGQNLSKMLEPELIQKWVSNIKKQANLDRMCSLTYKPPIFKQTLYTLRITWVLVRKVCLVILILLILFILLAKYGFPQLHKKFSKKQSFDNHTQINVNDEDENAIKN